MAGSRRLRAGSIAARRSTSRPTRCSGVLPPWGGRAHCGVIFSRATSTVRRRAPAVQRRAPLRLLVAEPPHRPARASSRCPTGGLHCGRSSRVTIRSLAPGSRRSTAGSIAACRPSGSRGRRSGAPAVPRRAPLRRDHPGRHRLPDAGVCSRRPTAGRVLRPSDGGLHCGASNFRPITGSGQCAPAVGRRAPTWRPRCLSVTMRNCHGPVNRLCASAKVVTLKPGSARMQVSAHFAP